MNSLVNKSDNEEGRIYHIFIVGTSPGSKTDGFFPTDLFEGWVSLQIFFQFNLKIKQYFLNYLYFISGGLMLESRPTSITLSIWTGLTEIYS